MGFRYFLDYIGVWVGPAGLYDIFSSCFSSVKKNASLKGFMQPPFCILKLSVPIPCRGEPPLLHLEAKTKKDK